NAALPPRPIETRAHARWIRDRTRDLLQLVSCSRRVVEVSCVGAAHARRAGERCSGGRAVARYSSPRAAAPGSRVDRLRRLASRRPDRSTHRAQKVSDFNVPHRDSSAASGLAQSAGREVGRERKTKMKRIMMTMTMGAMLIGGAFAQDDIHQRKENQQDRIA